MRQQRLYPSFSRLTATCGASRPVSLRNAGARASRPKAPGRVKGIDAGARWSFVPLAFPGEVTFRASMRTSWVCSRLAEKEVEPLLPDSRSTLICRETHLSHGGRSNRRVWRWGGRRALNEKRRRQAAAPSAGASICAAPSRAVGRAPSEARGLEVQAWTYRTHATEGTSAANCVYGSSAGPHEAGRLRMPGGEPAGRRGPRLGGIRRLRETMPGQSLRFAICLQPSQSTPSLARNTLICPGQNPPFLRDASSQTSKTRGDRTINRL
jgi:hypothetical protein